MFNFAARLCDDNVSLSLVLGCIDTYDVLACRRVSRAWQAASRKPEAWLDSSLTLNSDQLLLVPPSSIAQLQRLWLVHDQEFLAAGATEEEQQAKIDADAALVLQRLAGMTRLHALRLEGFVVDAHLCQLISANAGQLRELDMRACSEFAELSSIATEQHEQLVQQAAHGADDWVPDTVDASRESRGADGATLAAAAASAASPAVAAALLHLAAPHALPVLHLPVLRVLRTPSVYSLRHFVSLVGQLPALEVLEAVRCGETAHLLDARSTEQHFVTLLNRALVHLYSHRLRSLALGNSRFVPFSQLHLSSLTRLTHVSLTQHDDLACVDERVLRTLAHEIPTLQTCSVCTGGDRPDGDWWAALAQVRTLTCLTTVRSEHDIAAGVALVLASLPLQRLQTWSMAPAVLDAVRQHAHLHTVCLTGPSLPSQWVEALHTLPQLRSLAVVTRTRTLDDATLEHVARLLVRLETLSLRSARSEPALGAVTSAWAALASMPRLACLEFIGYSAAGDQAVDEICARMARTAELDAHAQRRAMRVFAGMPAEAAAVVHGPTCCLRELRTTSRMLSREQSRRLLRAGSRLRTVAVYMMHWAANEFVHLRDEPNPRCVAHRCLLLQHVAYKHDIV